MFQNIGGPWGVFGALLFVIAIIDIEKNPAGTSAGLNGLNGILKTSLNGALGYKS